MKFSEIFSKEELEYLLENEPDLVPMDVLPRSDFKTLEVPSMSDVNIFSNLSLDQIVIGF